MPTLLFVPTRDTRDNKPWMETYDRAKPDEDVCGEQIHTLTPGLVCTRPSGHRADWHIAHQSSGMTLAEVQTHDMNGEIWVSDTKTGKREKVPPFYPFPTNT